MAPGMIALYVGPDQMMPVASILATIAGFVLIFWHKLLNVLRRLAGAFKRSTENREISNPAERQPPQAQ